jgi:hypothetical protein
MYMFCLWWSPKSVLAMPGQGVAKHRAPSTPDPCSSAPYTKEHKAFLLYEKWKTAMIK